MTKEYSEIKDVQALKRHLQGLCGLPRFSGGFNGLGFRV